jgi:hypothetical protein
MRKNQCGEGGKKERSVGGKRRRVTPESFHFYLLFPNRILLRWTARFNLSTSRYQYRPVQTAGRE